MTREDYLEQMRKQNLYFLFIIVILENLTDLTFELCNLLSENIDRIHL